MNFSGKVVWLTGASNGIGRSLAIELCRRGARVAMTARSRSTLIGLSGELQSSGFATGVYAGDVTDAEAMRAIAARIESEMGPIDTLIANAGTYTPGNAATADTAEVLRQMDVNYGGTVRCIAAVMPAMLNRKRGTVVAVSSLAGYRGMPEAAAYSASKAAITAYLEGLRLDLKSAAIKVVLVSPGFVRTRLTDLNEFQMPFRLEPEAAAALICDGLERGRMEVAFPRSMHWTFSILRVLPHRVYDWVMQTVWKRLQRR